MRYRFLMSMFAAVAIMVAALFAGPPAQAGDPAVCAVYAASAVSQQKKNKNMGCGYAGPAWSKNYGGHYAWCLGAGNPMIQAETNKRAALLANCGGGNQQIQAFLKPKIQGVRLDWCYKWAQFCGQAAAEAYCAAKGFNDAKGFEKDDDIGYTRVIGSGQICNDPNCDGFTYVKCGN